MAKKQTCVLYIERNKLLFYEKLAKSVLQLDLNSDIISDLEVLNTEKLEQLIDNFFHLPVIKGKEFDAVLVFSQSISFDKDIEDGTSKTVFEETQKFLDTVPFEDILSNSYRIGKKTKIIGVNKNLYEILRHSLEKNKNHLLMVLPMTVLVALNPELKNKIDLSFIESKSESFAQYSLVNLNLASIEGEEINSMGIKRKDVRLYVLLGIFALLIIILFILVYSTFIAPQKTTKKKTIAFPRITATPTPNKNQNPVASGSGVNIVPTSILVNPSK